MKKNSKKDDRAVLKAAITDSLLVKDPLHEAALEKIDVLYDTIGIQQENIEKLNTSVEQLMTGLNGIVKLLDNFSLSFQKYDVKIEELEYTFNELISLVKAPMSQPDLPVLFNKKDTDNKPN